MTDASQYYPPHHGIASSSTINLDQSESHDQPILSPERQPKVKWYHKTVDTAFGKWSIAKFFQLKYLKWHLLFIFVLVFAALMTVYHHQIVMWMRPFAQKLQVMKAGWVIPIVILFVISFPPLFGHEIIAILCGVVWGTWVGFGIVAAGTLLGEIGNYIMFRYFCMARAAKWERREINYACMVRVINEGGFRMILLARLSAIPAHLTTPLFAFSGMSFPIFFLATFLTLPKQLQVTYLGDIFDEETSDRSTTSKIITNTVLVLSFVITLGCAWYIYRAMAKWRPIIEQERREAEEGKIQPAFLLPAQPQTSDLFSAHHAAGHRPGLDHLDSRTHITPNSAKNYGSHQHSPTLDAYSEFNTSTDTITPSWPDAQPRHTDQPENSFYGAEEVESHQQNNVPRITVQEPSRSSMQSWTTARTDNQ